MEDTLNTPASQEEAGVEKVEISTAAVESKKPVKEKLAKGMFIVSPTGKYNLAYNVGEKASLPELQALELEEAGYFKLAK